MTGYKVKAKLLDSSYMDLEFGPFLSHENSEKCLLELAGRSNVRGAIITRVALNYEGDEV